MSKRVPYAQNVSESVKMLGMGIKDLPTLRWLTRPQTEVVATDRFSEQTIRRVRASLPGFGGGAFAYAG